MKDMNYNLHDIRSLSSRIFSCVALEWEGPKVNYRFRSRMIFVAGMAQKVGGDEGSTSNLAASLGDLVSKAVSVGEYGSRTQAQLPSTGEPRSVAAHWPI
jgi:hypothetical protein